MVHHLQHLLFYGADMNARNASGNTPLHVCAVNNQVTGSQKLGRGIAGIMEMRETSFTPCFSHFRIVVPKCCCFAVRTRSVSTLRARPLTRYSR